MCINVRALDKFVGTQKKITHINIHSFLADWESSQTISNSGALDIRWNYMGNIIKYLQKDGSLLN